MRVLALVLLLSLVACSQFREAKVLEIDCGLVCKKCEMEELILKCGTDWDRQTSGEDKGVNIISDLGGIVK